MQQNAYKQSIRWSDYYRLQYLPMLMQIVDHHIMTDQVGLCDVAEVFRRLDVPEYLWLYCANFTKYQEVYNIMRLETASVAAGEYLNMALRKQQRNIQQFGLQPQMFYDDRTKNQIEELIINKELTVQQLSNFSVTRKNYFTSDPETRTEMRNEALKLVVVSFFNDLLGTDVGDG